LTTKKVRLLARNGTSIH